MGGDPAAIAFDGATSAKAKGTPWVLIDTAGRLHTKDHLMKELDKIRRSLQKVIPEAPHRVLLVLDATTGQNGLVQAEAFARTAGVTDLVLTKLDGSAKGGVVVPILDRLKLPIAFVGVGEGVDDLVPFDAEAFVDGPAGCLTWSSTPRSPGPWPQAAPGPIRRTLHGDARFMAWRSERA